MATADFQVTVGEFSGPLDLILTLIEERKMLVSDVSLSKVADNFIAYIKNQEAFPAGQTAHFILVAATLLLIKSRSLLPVLSLTGEEEENIDELEKRLALYKIFRDASKKIASLSGRLYFGGHIRNTEPVFAPAPDMNVPALYSAMLGTLQRVPQKEIKKEVSVKTVVSLEEMMERLTKRIEQALSLTLKEFIGKSEDRREIVVGFLAVLELVKRGLVMADQMEDFSDITVVYQGKILPPRYN